MEIETGNSRWIMPIRHNQHQLNKLGKTKTEVAERTGLEPATPGVTGRYSNQLNYRSAVGSRAFYSKTPGRQA